ncbi:dihydroxyacetone kinase phosphoryl donor subunit DhaM [Thermorudis peleae]|uniref:dihydroxyacetone kinase phosphoryl donor subunit DhaM n=1 Tax=Thermorudis peleae TaxID=1382356 RepID=UPI00056EB3BA|nr:dihydroxyacetone kinase phosphoryl donor subunit DhaM [Thermorudis peleae]MBX6753739.1 PTS-dependent dihydroxyacetone kinase phosphotransferase subunit DhaM [Thermorudis peleae]
MVALVIVSHSAKLAEGVRELAAQMAPAVPIFTAGGLDEQTLGTNAERIYQAIEAALAQAEAVLVLVDLGSAVLSTQFALDQLPADARARVRLSSAPLVEGAVVAAVEAAIGKSLDDVAEAAEAAASLPKLP